MRYAVVGLGAIGSVVGGLIAKSGEDVILIGKERQVNAINKGGMKIDGIFGEEVIKCEATTDFSMLEKVDVIFLCVKSQDTANVATMVFPFIEDSLIVSLQNGVRNVEIMEKIGLSAISSVVLFNAVYLKPSHVTLTMKGGFILEKNEKYEKKISSICRSLKKAGFHVKLEKNIYGLLWSKLILNLQNAITALTGQSIRESLIDDISRKMIISTMKEGIDIVKKSGMKLEALPGIDPKLILLALSFLGPLAMPIGKFLFKIREDARSSMWQSLARGRPTEIEYINGEIVRLAEKNGLKSPINAKLVQLVKSAERGNKKSFEPRELRRILGI